MLRVMTLNIWNLMGAWGERRVEIVAWIDRVEPDIVCLQEVVESPDGKNQAAWLAEQAAGEWHVAFAGAPVHFVEGILFGNAILSRWPIDSSRTARLPFEHRSDDTQRLVLHARTLGLDVFCTHLNWRLDDGYMREIQAQEVARQVTESADPASPLPPILAGDFNAQPDSNEMRFLTGLAALGGRSVFFQDAWRVAGGEGPGYTWDNHNPFAAQTHEPNMRIDYVRVGWRREGGAGQITSARVVCDEPLTGTYATDHFGLVAEVADAPE